MNCPTCKDKDEIIKNLRGEIAFHKGEQAAWRALFEQQRGGEAYSAVQRELAAARGRICELEGKS